MRVAYVCADAGIPVFGSKGCSIHVQEFVRALMQAGAEVRLYASRIGGTPPRDLHRAGVCELLIDLGGDVAQRERAALAANADVLRALERDGPFDLVYERYALFSFSGMEYARAIGVPGVLEVNAPLIEEQAEYRQLIDRKGAESAARRAFKAASVLIAVSQEVALYLDQFVEASGRVEVVANGVDADEFKPRPGNVRAEGFTVGFVGSLKPWHGLPDLIEAFSRLKQLAADPRLLIVGDGPERNRLEEDLAARGLVEAVQLTGAVAHSEVPALLASMDAAVAPYPKLDNFYFSPLKVFEYMSAGLPIVASRTGQVAQLIEDGVTGLLYQPGDVGAMSEALMRLRSDPQLRVDLGRAARATILRGHTWKTIVERILEISRRNQTSVTPNQRVAN